MEIESRIHLRGFGSMNKKDMRKIASLGGKTAHKTGKAHEFTSEEATEAGKIGGKRLVAKRGRKYMRKIGRKGGSN